jgi:hypothetical protein
LIIFCVFLCCVVVSYCKDDCWDVVIALIIYRRYPQRKMRNLQKMKKINKCAQQRILINFNFINFECVPLFTHFYDLNFFFFDILPKRV